MFCSHCGQQIPDTSKFCPRCGADVSMETKAANTATNMFNSAENELTGAIKDVATSVNGGSSAGPAYGERLTDNRGLFSYIILSIITLGIYRYYFVWKMAHDVNIACADDGDQTGGLVQYILLSFITCGFYDWYWQYKLANRLASNAPRYGMNFQENGTTVIMWCLFGSLICGIGPFVAMNILITNSNKICNAYNRYNGL